MLLGPSSDSANRRATAARGTKCPECGTVYPSGLSHCPLDGTTLTSELTPGDGHSPLRLLPQPGSRVHNYRLLEVLGEGSMGRVYLAENETIGRVVALKMLHPALLHDKTATEHFINEARTVNQIRHRNIIEITDFVVTDNGNSCFLVMERLEGQTLEHVLCVAAPLPTERAVRIAEQICDALAAAHAVGVVHRDLKPGNVFVTARENEHEFVKLIDFGVAKVLRSATEQIRTTMGGVADLRYIIGTPAYMSPEQTTDGAIDHRADIYAVGVLLYEMLTGQLPFGGKTLQELLEAHRYAMPCPPSQCPGLLTPIPAPLEQLVLRCLAKSPDDRPPTMATVRHTLGELRDAFSGATLLAAPAAPVAEAPWDTSDESPLPADDYASFENRLPAEEYASFENRLPAEEYGSFENRLPSDDNASFEDGLVADDYAFETMRLPRRQWPVVLLIATLAGLAFAGYALLTKRGQGIFAASPSAEQQATRILDTAKIPDTTDPAQPAIAGTTGSAQPTVPDTTGSAQPAIVEPPAQPVHPETPTTTAVAPLAPRQVAPVDQPVTSKRTRAARRPRRRTSRSARPRPAPVQTYEAAPPAPEPPAAAPSAAAPPAAAPPAAAPPATTPPADVPTPAPPEARERDDQPDPLKLPTWAPAGSRPPRGSPPSKGLRKPSWAP